MNMGRIGMDGTCAEVGDIVEVVKGRKYPVGMRMVVNGFDAWCKYASTSGRSFRAYGDTMIVFGGEGKMESINAKNVKIIAQNETRLNNPLYKNVHNIEIARSY